MHYGYQSYRPQANYRHMEGGHEFSKWQQKPYYETQNRTIASPAVKYVRKNNIQMNTDLKPETPSINRIDTPPTSCSSSEGKNQPDLKAALMELRSVISGKPINQCHCFPKIHPKMTCQANLLPLPEFLAQNK